MFATLVAVLLAAQAKPPALLKDESTLVKIAPQARQPSLAFDADGNAYVAFVRNGNIEVAVSTDGGKSFDAPVTALDAQGSITPVPHRGPQIAVDRQKRVYVSGAFCLTPKDSPVVNDLFLAVSTDRGKTFGKPSLLNDAPKSALESVHASAAGGAELHVAWLDSRNPKGLTLAYAKFSDQGKRLGKTVLISSSFCCERCPPALAVDPRGNPFIAYRETSPANRRILLVSSTDGGKTFGAPAPLPSVDSGIEECPLEPPALACSADGKLFVAAWMDQRGLEHDRNVYWAFGPPGKLGRDTDPHDDRRYSQRRPSVAIDAEGTFWCAWEDSRLSILRTFYSTTKNPVNRPLGDAKEGPGGVPCLAAFGTRVAVVYECGNGVGFRLLAGP